MAARKPKAAPKAARLKVVAHDEARDHTAVSLGEMSDTVLWCRINHHWEWMGDNVVTRRNYVVEVTRRWECDRCTAWKEETRDVPSFEVTKKRSNYPPGFLSNEGRLSRADILFEQFSRAGYKIKRMRGAD